MSFDWAQQVPEAEGGQQRRRNFAHLMTKYPFACALARGEDTG